VDVYDSLECRVNCVLNNVHSNLLEALGVPDDVLWQRLERFMLHDVVEQRVCVDEILTDHIAKQPLDRDHASHLSFLGHVDVEVYL
jgi:hypothetical protein